MSEEKWIHVKSDPDYRGGKAYVGKRVGVDWIGDLFDAEESYENLANNFDITLSEAVEATQFWNRYKCDHCDGGSEELKLIAGDCPKCLATGWLPEVNAVLRQLQSKSAAIAEAPTSGHYKTLSPEPLEVIEAWGLGFHLGNVIKYVGRNGRKKGEDARKELEKALWYLRRHIELLGDES